MRRRIACAFVTCAVLAAAPAWAQSSSKQVADEIIALVKAQWAAGQQKNTTDEMRNVADDYTEFNSDYSTRLDGREMAVRLVDAGNQGAGRNLVAEMANPRVQVYGDVAILSYNYVGLTQDKEGKTEPVRAKSTRVYAKQGGKWMLVHANFGADPAPK